MSSPLTLPLAGDSPNCVHQATPRGSCALPPSTITPEWSPGDDYFRDGELPGSHAHRRGSAHRSAETLTSRLSRHWPYLSNRWKSGRPPTSIHSPKVRSAPSSRSNSLRMPSFRQSSAAMPLDFSQALTPPITPVDANAEANELSGPRGISRPHKPVSIAIPEPAEDPVDRQMTSTPLLPPMMGEHPSQDLAPVQSPLQSPTVATGSTSSLVSTPTLTPTFAAIPTPPLSSKPSLTSFGAARAPHGPKPPTEIPSMSISAETDPWAAKLGHANFHISPEPYFPASCDLQSCKALVDAWAAARTEFMRHAARITEHYGPTSQVYQLTQEKWAETDKQWRQYHDQAKAAAGISDDATALLQPLAETQALSKMPSLEDPQQPSKFPVTNEADFVGPMVKYVKIQPRRSRKPTFLRLFTDPASLLAGARSPFAFKR